MLKAIFIVEDGFAHKKVLLILLIKLQVLYLLQNLQIKKIRNAFIGILLLPVELLEKGN